MFLDHTALVSHRPMHIDIANGGFDGPTAHGATFDAGVEQADPALTREVHWRAALERVFSRRRNAIARTLQKWACGFEVWLARRCSGQPA